jgi:replication factor C small subunit
VLEPIVKITNQSIKIGINMSAIEFEANRKKKESYTLWVEKYRPSSLGTMLLPKEVKSLFKKYIKEKEIPNLLFHSTSPGTGKTSAAKSIANDIGADYIYINASLENGIDILRSKIERFALSFSDKGKKIVILDEFEGSSRSLQDALRANIEAVQNSCRFIIICNHIHRIIDPLQSRCKAINFSISDKETKDEMIPLIIERITKILKVEKINDTHIVFDEAVVKKMVEMLYPDMRKMLITLQEYSKINGTVDTGVFDFESVDSELYTLIINKKLTAARKFILDNNYNYEVLYRALYDNLLPLIDDKSKQAQTIISIAEYMYRDAFVIDKEINFVALLLELMSIL